MHVALINSRSTSGHANFVNDETGMWYTTISSVAITLATSTQIALCFPFSETDKAVFDPFS